MATNKAKLAKERERLLKIRDLEPRDGMELMRILAAAGGGEQVGQAVGLAIRAFRSSEPGANDVVIQAASTAVVDGLHAALRDREVTNDLERLLYDLWSPPLTLSGDEDYEEKKREAFRKLGMQGYFMLIDTLRKSEDFADFLAYVRDFIPTETTSTGSSTESSETTGSDEAAS